MPDGLKPSEVHQIQIRLREREWAGFADALFQKLGPTLIVIEENRTTLAWVQGVKEWIEIAKWAARKSGRFTLRWLLPLAVSYWLKRRGLL